MTDAETRHVLIIDDDAAARRMLRRVLERRGFRVEEQGDGRSGLDAIVATRPDVVLLDLRMPGELSGFDVASLVKAEADLDGIAVVVVSASVHLDARSAAKTIGCDAFVEKPVDFDELLAAIDEVAPR
ncbi:MAG: histidine kinase [Thermoleophilia bacterium]|nr:histidine kinase [Thermoleophilia bacterium]